MRRDGTVPLSPSPGRVPAKKETNGTTRAPPAPAFELDLRGGFIEGRRAGLPSRALARLNGPPEATLDLHRRDAESARALLAEFLERERAKGAERVLVIVGKGRHSAGGFGVLRSEIGDWLASAPLSAHVLAFATARPELGGTGCVSILLSPSRARKR